MAYSRLCGCWVAWNPVAEFFIWWTSPSGLSEDMVLKNPGLSPWMGYSPCRILSCVGGVWTRANEPRKDPWDSLSNHMRGNWLSESQLARTDLFCWSVTWCGRHPTSIWAVLASWRLTNVAFSLVTVVYNMGLICLFTQQSESENECRMIGFDRYIDRRVRVKLNNSLVTQPLVVCKV